MSLFFYLKEDKLLVSLRPTTQGQHSVIVKSELPFPGCVGEKGELRGGVDVQETRKIKEL